MYLADVSGNLPQSQRTLFNILNKQTKMLISLLSKQGRTILVRQWFSGSTEILTVTENFQWILKGVKDAL